MKENWSESLIIMKNSIVFLNTLTVTLNKYRDIINSQENLDKKALLNEIDSTIRDLLVAKNRMLIFSNKSAEVDPPIEWCYKIKEITYCIDLATERFSIVCSQIVSALKSLESREDENFNI